MYAVRESIIMTSELKVYAHLKMFSPPRTKKAFQAVHRGANNDTFSRSKATQ